MWELDHKKVEHWRTDAFERWYWRRLLRISRTAKRLNQPILKEINSAYLLEGLIQHIFKNSYDVNLIANVWPIFSFSGGEKKSILYTNIKNPPAMQKTCVQSLGWEDTLEESMVTPSSILAFRILTDRGTRRATVRGVHRVRHNWVTKHIFTLSLLFFLSLVSLFP